MALIGILVLNSQCSNDGISGSIFVNFRGCNCDISGSVICVEYLRGKKLFGLQRERLINIQDVLLQKIRTAILPSPFLFGFACVCIKKNEKTTNSVTKKRDLF